MSKKKRNPSPAAAGAAVPAEPRKPAKPKGHKPGGKKTEWEKVLHRYLAATTVWSVLALLYMFHPYYQGNQFKPWRPAFWTAYLAWLSLGLPYVMATVRRFGGIRMDLTDNAVHWALWFKGVWNFLAEGCRWPRHVWSNRRMRITVLSLGVKTFFTPLMFIFIAEHFTNIWTSWFRRKGVPVPSNQQLDEWARSGLLTLYKQWTGFITEHWDKLAPTWQGAMDTINIFAWSRGDWHFGFDLYYQFLFFVDTLVALVGYGLESRWLNNKTKSVEPTLFGWMVALMCYPPFNNISGTYFPLGRSGTLFTDPFLVDLCRVLMLAAFTIYVLATIAFGPTFSNLTNRGIITRGPYAWIRHPAYACKNFAWWMEYLPYAGHWSTFLWLIAWNIIYGLRAWTEERHLSKDPAYLEYKKKVPWVAIPGVW